MEFTAKRSKQKPRKMTAALSISLCFHLIFAIFVALTIQQATVEDDAISLEWVEPPPSIRALQKPVTKRIQPRIIHDRLVKVTGLPRLEIAAPTQISETKDQLPTPVQHDVDFTAKVPDTVVAPVTTTADVPAGPRDLSVSSPTASPQEVENGRRFLPSRFRAPSRGTAQSNARGGLLGSTGTADAAGIANPRLPNQIMVPENILGAVLVGEGREVQGHIRLIRLKHALSDWWQDPTAIPSFAKWLLENTALRADMKFAGGSLRLTDSRILDAPLIIMTGHDKDITVGRNLVKGGPLAKSFSSEERAALRKYIVERGGMLFFDDCGFNGLFAAIVADELYTVFPEYPLENIPHNHELYTTYYELPLPPTGGDVFWGSENKPMTSQFRYQKGITVDNRLAVLYNRKDYMCAMETMEIESRTLLRMRRSTDVHRFMTNLLIYAMKHGGNTDRSGYKP